MKRNMNSVEIEEYLRKNGRHAACPACGEDCPSWLMIGGTPCQPTVEVSINDLVQEAHQNAINKGWYDDPRSFGEMIALMHSELSEALEDYRQGCGYKEIYYQGDKPCGIPTELADVIIRIFDTCGYLGIDLETAIQIKMKYNSTRPQRHGGKKL